MTDYKLYKVTVEKEFVVAAPVDLKITEVENSVENIMIIHEDSLRSEGLSHVVAEEINDLGALPAGWEGGCIPYTNFKYSNMPEALVNKTIKEYLNGNYKTNA
jgi:hypothetical protein